MLYAMSDIHGCIDELKTRMERIDLSGENRLIFLGDYLDYGDSSCQVLKYILELQKQYGGEKIIVLKGNHEQMFLDFIKDFNYPYGSDPEMEELMAYNDWIRTDFEYGANTIRTFLSKEQMDFLDKIARTASLETISRNAVRMVLSGHEALIRWMQGLPSYYETESQIFVHAGVDEDAGEYWKWGASDDSFLWKFPAAKGEFYKTIIAGHVGTGSRELANDRNFHDIYFDGKSHYYIDGSVYKGGKLLLLGYDEEEGAYYQIENDGKRRRILVNHLQI